MCEMTIRYELEDISMRPDQEPLLVEKIHSAAFKNNTLGLAKICPEENIGSFTTCECFHCTSMQARSPGRPC